MKKSKMKKTKKEKKRKTKKIEKKNIDNKLYSLSDGLCKNALSFSIKRK